MNLPPLFTAKQLREQLHYNPRTGEWTRLVALCNRVKVGDRAGCLDTHGYRQINVFGRSYLASRLAWFYMTGRWPQKEVDHRDLDFGNDRWNNLRLATHSQNQQNRTVKRTSLTGAKNIQKRADSGKYRLRMTIGGKRVTIGHYTTIRQAQRKYAMVVQVHGEFARMS